jgi:DNA-binding response OmpR family regulator
MARVLVVEDDPVSRLVLTNLLREEGHEVATVSQGAEAVGVVDQIHPDIVLLDVGLPDVGGVETCRRIRARSTVPIIFVSGRRDELDKVLALDAGGDDYVVKPFGSRELAARIRVVLRRRASIELPTSHLEGAGIVLDTLTRQVRVRGNKVALTPREFDLLRVLMSRANQIVTRQEILDGVWGVDFYGDESALYVYIRHLRRKIESTPDHPQLIQTVRGIGFRFVAVASSSPDGHDPT